MAEYTTIRLPRTMPLVERISVVSKEVSDWLESLEEPFNAGKDVMHLVKYTQNGRYTYQYVIHRAAK